MDLSLFPWTDEQLSAANINRKTRLATDYLNHFNDIIMMLEMLDSMPECLEEISSWQFHDYISHFENSALSQRQLVIDAYAHVCPHLLKAFETGCYDLKAVIENLIDRLNKAKNKQDISLISAHALPCLQGRTQQLRHLINHGLDDGEDLPLINDQSLQIRQNEIDSFFD